MKALNDWQKWARRLRTETYAVYLAYRDSRTPWYARIFAACVVGYAFSPLDLIPDPIPILGYLDDLILIPAGIAVALKMIPPQVMDECRHKARAAMLVGRPRNWAAAVVILGLWLALAAVAIWGTVRLVR